MMKLNLFNYVNEHDFDKKRHMSLLNCLMICRTDLIDVRCKLR